MNDKNEGYIESYSFWPNDSVHNIFLMWVHAHTVDHHIEDQEYSIPWVYNK